MKEEGKGARAMKNEGRGGMEMEEAERERSKDRGGTEGGRNEEKGGRETSVKRKTVKDREELKACGIKRRKLRERDE